MDLTPDAIACIILINSGHSGQAIPSPDDPFRTFDEWNSAADAKAYGKL